MKYRLFSVVLCLAMVFSLFGCMGQPQVPETEPTTAPVETTEPAPSETDPPAPEITWKTLNTNVQKGRDKADFLTTKSGNINFYLEAACFDEESASSLVRKVTTFCEAIGVFAQPEALRLYAGENVDPDTQVGKVFLHLTGEKEPTLADFWQIYTAMCGSIQDHGAAFGMAALACREKELCSAEPVYDDEALASYFSNKDNLFLLDLTLPLLEDRLVDQEQVDYARSAAIRLAEFAAQKNGRSSLTADYKEDADAELKNDWLRSIGAKPKYTPFASLPFERNSESNESDYPYIVRAESVDWYFSRRDINDQGYCSFLTKYLEMAECMELDFADARSVLAGYIDSEVPNVKVYTDYSVAGNAGAVYIHSVGIYLYHDWSNAGHALLHEYIHYLVPDIVMYNGTANEAITEEIATYACTNHLRIMSYCSSSAFVSNAKRNHCWNRETDQLDLALYNEMMAFTYAMSAPGSTEYLDIGGGYIIRPEKLTFSSMTYSEGASIAHYLIELYGRDS